MGNIKSQTTANAHAKKALLTIRKTNIIIKKSS